MYLKTAKVTQCLKWINCGHTADHMMKSACELYIYGNISFDNKIKFKFIIIYLTIIKLH